MRARIVAAFDNVHMGIAHHGVYQLARKHKIYLEKLQAGELVLLLNRKRDRLKVVGNQGTVIGYVKMPHGSRLPLQAIQYIPDAFTPNGRIDIDVAIAKHVTAAFAAKLGGKTLSVHHAKIRAVSGSGRSKGAMGESHAAAS